MKLWPLRNLKKLSGLKVNSCGLFVSKQFHYLASSPDGVVTDANGLKHVVEAKCPYVVRQNFINPTTVPYLCTTDDVLALKSTHDYYYQIQGQLLCTGARSAYFVIYTFSDFKVLFIERNDDFIKSMVLKLTNFYDSHFKPTILKSKFFKIDEC